MSEGNTNSSSIKQGNQLKQWFMTWNNYPSSAVETLETVFKGLCERYAFQKEVGESGTPHIQGTFFLKKKMRWTEFNLPSGIHWEKTKAFNKSVEYCTKTDTSVGEPYVFGIVIPKKLKILEKEKLFDWQNDIIELIENEPNDRHIHWFWETVGNVGKSTFVKYLCYHHSALLVSGKGSDMKYLIVKYKEKYGDYPSVIIWDIPRTAENFISWSAMEEVKNGCFASTKYECEMVLMNCPHMLCFANFEPDYERVSKDRWVVKEL